jgi:microsomal dipeptidase-like Zn-dependent dipeptidase
VGTPAAPDLSAVGPGLIAASLPADRVVSNGQSLTSLGGDYWTGVPFQLGQAYPFSTGEWLAGPFQVTGAVVTFRAALDPDTQLTVDVCVYSPQTLTPPWTEPEAPAISDKTSSPDVPQRANTAPIGPGGTQVTTPGVGDRPRGPIYTDHYGRDVYSAYGPYCREAELSAAVSTSGPWQQLSIDMSSIQGTAAYVRFAVAGSGNAYINYLKQAATAPEGLDGADPAPPLWGFADLHSHPMAFMSMGGHFVSGAYAANSVDAADLPECNADHSRGIADIVVNNFPDGHQAGGRDGAPSFGTWPSVLDGIHQQMHPAWIKRAWQGGLRLLVALVVNNEMLAGMHAGADDLPHDDQDTIERQIAFFNDVIAANADWMEKARTPADARRIIGAGRLAIVFGIEVDSFLGQWLNEAQINTLAGPSPTPQQIHDVVKTRLQDLHDRLDVRQLNPVHLANNAFGGTSIYEAMFNLSNYWLHREWFVPEQAEDPGIDFRLDDPIPGWAEFLLALADFPAFVAIESIGLPDYGGIAPGAGHQNSVGASTIATQALTAMMELGMVIDVDHMGTRTAQFVLDQCLAAADPGSSRPSYPVVSAHTTFRALAPRRNWGHEDQPEPGQRSNGGLWPHESAKSEATAQAILGLGGMFAPITAQHDTLADSLLNADPPVPIDAAGTSKSYAQELRHAVGLAGDRGVGIGTDMTLVAQVAPRFGPLAIYGLAHEGPGGVAEKRSQAFAQTNGVAYDHPVGGQPRFFVPPDADATGKLNPYLVPQDSFSDSLIGGEYAFATKVWTALWLHEAGLPPGGDNDVLALTTGFATPGDQAASLGGLARTACELLNGIPLGSLTDPGDPHDARRQQAVVADGIGVWNTMKAGANTPLTRCVAGNYTFDFNVDGLAHYGLLPDLLQDLKNVGVGPTTLTALFGSAETYVSIWEQCEAIGAHLSGGGTFFARIREAVTTVNLRAFRL